MIVAMKKVTIAVPVSLKSSKDDALNALGGLGIVHLIGTEKPETLSALNTDQATLEKALSLADRYKKHNGPSRQEDRQAGLTALPPLNGLECATRLVLLNEELNRLGHRLDTLKKDYEQASLWGAFDPQEVSGLDKAGIHLHLYRCEERDLALIPLSTPFRIIARDRSTLFLAIVSSSLSTISGIGGSLPLPFHEMPLPRTSAPALLTQIDTLERERSTLIEEIHGLSTFRPAMEHALAATRAALDFEEARAAMISLDALSTGEAATNGPLAVSLLTGFCPVPRLDTLKGLARQQGWALLAEEPAEDDQVPTLLEHPKWMDSINPVLKFIGLVAGYREQDTNGVFLIFFTIFVALIIGDGGYGLLLFLSTGVVSVVARKRGATVPREVTTLFYLLAGATMVWGAVTGVWFGAQWIAQLPVLRGFVVPSLSAWSPTSGAAIMLLCIILGACHLSLAHLWKGMVKYPSLSAVAELGWVFLLWGLVYVVRHLVMSEPLSGATGYLVGIGAGLIVLFSGQTQELSPLALLKGVLQGLTQLPMTILSGIGAFSDLVSYLRLFAVGLATVEVALSFNKMAGAVGTATITATIGAMIIVILGHTVNTVTTAMSVLVHGLRLNLLEFSSHFEMEWAGISYKPFLNVQDPAGTDLQEPAHKRYDVDVHYDGDMHDGMKHDGMKEEQ